MATPKLELNGKTWGVYANYTDPAGQHHRKYKGGFESKAKARRWADEYLAEKRKSFVCESNLNIRQIVEKILKEKEEIDQVAQSTMKFYEQNFDIIVKHFGTFLPQQITVVALQEFVNSLLGTPRKCKAICQSLSILYHYMERMDLIERNLYKKIKAPEYRAKETAHYDLETYKKLLEILKKENNCIYTPVLLMGSLGLRPSEALALTNDDLSDDSLSIQKAGVTVKRKGQKESFIIGDTKTEKSKRTFPLDTEFIKKILSYKENNSISSPYLCVNKSGELMSYTVLKKNLQQIIERHNLPHISPYGLRHTFGQIQKSVGTDVYTISRLMGHSSIAITTKTYFHNDNELNRSAIAKITGIV